jgi:hypothetical protein
MIAFLLGAHLASQRLPEEIDEEPASAPEPPRRQRSRSRRR